MKPHSLLFARSALASAIAMLLAAPTASAVVWDGSSNGNWGNGANWATGTVPSAGNLIEFNNTSGTVTAIYLSAPRNVAGISFLSGNSAAQRIGLSTQPNNSGTAVNLTFTSNTTGIIVNDSRDHTVGSLGLGTSGDIVLLGSLPIATTSGNLLVNRPITDGASSFGVTKTGSGTLTLSAVNTYDGATQVSAGKLVVEGSISASAVTVSGTGTILATDVGATVGSTLVIESGAILAVGDAGNAATATATVGGATTFDNNSIFSWDINSNGTSYDKLVTTNVLGGVAAGDSVFRIVVADTAFSNGFWAEDQSWNNIFTTDGNAANAISGWSNVFGNTVSVVDSNFDSFTPMAGTFSISGSTLTWTAVPEPSSAFLGTLLAFGLLRRRRQG
jgi:fibronectin-binding autotransporter adhesin